MRLLKFLTEVFDMNVPIKIGDDNQIMFQATFNIRGIEYVFKADYYDEYADWQVNFGDTKDGDMLSHPLLRKEAANEEGSGIKQCFKKGIQSQKPKAFTFYTIDKTLEDKLYSKPIFHKYITKISGFKYKDKIQRDGHTHWRFVK